MYEELTKEMTPDEVVELARSKAPRLHPLTKVLDATVIHKPEGGFETVSPDYYVSMGMASGTGTITCDDPEQQARMNRPEIRRRLTLAMLTNRPEDYPDGAKLSVDLTLPGDEPVKPRDPQANFDLGWIPDPE